MNTQEKENNKLSVSLFEEFTLRDANGQEFNISNQRGRAIIAILCLNPGEPLRRDMVSKLIWAGRFKQQARASLRQCLHELNRELQTNGWDGLDATNTQLMVNPNLIRTDLKVLEEALNTGDDTIATQLLEELAGKKILPNLDLGEALDDWLTAQRMQVENRLRIATDRLLSLLRANGENERHDALNMAWQAWTGVARLRMRNGLAVLPFKQIDEVGGDFYLAEGVVEELSFQLGGNNGIALAGRTSVEAVSDAGLTLTEMGAKLGVTHFIEGTIHRTQETVSLSIRVIDGSTGEQIWSDRIDAPQAKFIEERKVIGANLISDLCRSIGIEKTTTQVRRMTRNSDAYVLYLQGRMLIQRPMVEGAIEKAIQLFERALEIDPEFAECWTVLAEAHIHTTVYTPCVERVARSEQAAKCAKRALELNPRQGYAHAILSIHEWTRFNPSGALEYAMQAYRLEPENADVTMRLGSCLLYLGRTREALPYIEAAIDQDPVFGRNYVMLCVAHLNLGNIEEALNAGRQIVDLGMPAMHHAIVQAAAGDNEAAVATYYDIRQYVGIMITKPPGLADVSDEARDFYILTAAKGVCSGKAEDREIYCNLIEALHQTLLDPYDQSLCWPAVWMGHAEFAMKLYRERIHPANMPGLMSLWTDFDPIRRTREHPDFMAFAEDIGMVDAWEKYGWPDLIPSDPR